jgi:CRP/FNR family cyclic AMP-dependent transcriptional regulator
MNKPFDEFLAEVPMFRGLDHSVLSDLTQAARPINCAAGEYLFKQGQQSDGMYLIQEGKVCVEVRTPGDEVLQVAEATGSDVLGEMALMDDGLRSASARALEDTLGHFISRQRFEMLKSDLRPAGIAVTTRLAKGVSSRCRVLMEEISGELSTESDTVNKASLVQKYLTQGKWPCDHSVLRQFRSFTDFTDNEITAFINGLERLKMPSGEVLHSLGDPPDGLYIVLRGALRLGLSSTQKNFQFNIHGPGQMAGYIEVLEGRTRAADITTRETSELIYLPTDRFNEICREKSPYVFKLLGNLSAQSVSQLRKINNIASRIASFGKFVQ